MFNRRTKITKFYSVLFNLNLTTYIDYSSLTRDIYPPMQNINIFE